MAVPTTITDLSVTASSNGPSGTESPNTLDDYIRAQSAILRKLYNDVTDGTVPASNATRVGGTTPTAAGLALIDDADAAAQRVTLGLTSAATATIGTAANNLVQLDGSAKLPAVDGSQLTNLPTPSQSPVVRQTVLSGPVDSNGFSSFGGSTGSTTVTASGTLKATAAAGGDLNYTGSIANPSWTGLSTNGTMYLYLDITSGGVVTTGSTTLAPVYQFGGTYSTTNIQNTFNIQEMTMKVGNGSAASQVYRVFVGEVTVSGGVVTAIVWYALMGRALVTQAAISSSSIYSLNHNLGTTLVKVQDWLYCKTAELNYSIGDTVRYAVANVASGASSNSGAVCTSGNAVRVNFGYGTHYIPNKTATSVSSITFSNWGYQALVERAW